VVQALEALPRRARRIALVLPDRTRDAGLDRLLPAILEGLKVRGLGEDHRVALFASGIHAPMSQAEMFKALGQSRAAFIPIAHDARHSPMREVDGGPSLPKARLNAALFDADAVVVLSAMSVHYLAGFGGGRKMIAPGLADDATARAVHQHCMQAGSPPRRHPLARAGILEENPIHQAILPLLGALPPTCGITVHVEENEVVDVEGGELLTHHASLAHRYAGRIKAKAPGAPYDGALISAGGWPHDGDLVQTHKALVAIRPLLKAHAPIFLAAALDDGMGPSTFTQALLNNDAAALLARLDHTFAIGLQTAWSLRTVLEAHPLHLHCRQPAEAVREMGMVPSESWTALWQAAAKVPGQVVGLPQGGRRLYLPPEKF
jgi:nickel-dependent lactate racemase